MCGFAGFCGLEPFTISIDDCVKQMTKAMHHRGPDASGIMIVQNSPAIVFGHARLSIIDLSAESSQPMIDSESGNTIVYNGEIYNFKILKRELETHGHTFKTLSDTEVILKAYSEWGAECCKKLRGIFAFAIMDRKNEKLFLARDPIGVKPLYFFSLEDRLIFASEVRALLASTIIPRKLDIAGLNSYLTYGSVQEPLTLIQGIRSFPAGNFAYYSSKNGLQISKYWNPPSEIIKLPKREVITLVHEKLKETIKQQLVADVPLGVFLSGGIDSSAIVSLARQVHSGSIKTFSIIFKDPLFDERRYAKLVSEANMTDHIELEMRSDMILANLSKALNDFDQPSLDGLNTWFISRLVKEAGLTVALSGVGGDELFLGYGGYRKELMLEMAQPMLSILPSSLGKILQNNTHSGKIKRIGEMIGSDSPGYFKSRMVFSQDQRQCLLENLDNVNEAWAESCFKEVIRDGTRFSELLTRISYYELKTYMLSTLLRDSDQMSMAHSLELRVPLIDPEVVQLLLALPVNTKRSKTTPKPLLVVAGGQGIPRECIFRKKQGFNFPYDQYFNEKLGTEIKIFFNESSNMIFNKKSLLNTWDDYMKGRVSWSRVWTLFVIGLWLTSNKIEN